MVTLFDRRLHTVGSLVDLSAQQVVNRLSAAITEALSRTQRMIHVLATGYVFPQRDCNVDGYSC
jgi:hypothetical protein